MPLKIWSRRIKIGVVAMLLISTAFMNGLFTGQTSEGAVVERTFTPELIGWNNLILTLKESWFAFVAFFAYLLLNRYNNMLDEEEQRLIEK